LHRVAKLRAVLSCALTVFCVPTLAQAPQDVPRDHWAYSAVEDLASKGLIKGYPPDGKFFGKRTVTRYEMATIVQRVLARIDELLAQKADKSAIPPTQPAGVTEAQLNEVRRLVNEYRTELTVIGTDLQKVKDQIGDLKTQVDAVKGTADRAAQDAAAAQAETAKVKSDLADLSEAFQLGRVEFENLNKDFRAHKISGYIQGRFEAFGPGAGELFTPTGAGGTGQAPTTGGPVVGGPKYGFLVRRARIKVSGPVTTRTDYTAQIDIPSTGAVAVKDAYINIADLPLPNYNGTFGLFPPPFGVELVASSSTRESPERALAFSDSTAASPMFKTSTNALGGVVTGGSVLPLFLGQDRDNGAAFTWNSPNMANATTKVTLGVFNGEGRAAGGVRNLNRGLDVVGRATTTLLGGNLDVGVSGYYGSLAVRSAPPTGTTPAPFRNAYRLLGGADVRYYSPWGTQFRAEYIGGVFETTPDRALYLENNHVQAWYFMARHPLSKRLDVAVKYDEFMPISQLGKYAAGLGRMDLTRKTIQGGLLYYMDDATRFRLWYAQGLTPYDPSAKRGPLRSRLGFVTAEVQVTY
jgi:hypothetical protein